MWQNRITKYSDEAPDQLLANPRNFRMHPDSQAGALRGVLTEVGIVQNVIANERTGFLIDGHLRVMEALKSGQPTIPVTWVDVSEDEEALILATLDPIAALAGTDTAKLEALLHDVSTADAAVQQMLDTLATEAGIVPGIAEGNGGDEFDTTPEDEPTRTAVGDLWLIGGKHRLLVGDCTIAENVARLMDGDKPFLMITDPPYGVEYNPGWRDEAAAAGYISYAAARVGNVAHDDRVDWNEAWMLFTGDVVYCWHADRHARTVQTSLEQAGFEMRCQVIWAKPRFVISRGHYHWQHEPCWYAVRKGATADWTGDRSQTTLWEIGMRDDTPEYSNHGTQKPLDCMARPMRNHGNEDTIVYDPFLGSGTTLIAAHRTGRRCYGLEIEPRYADVILRRAEAEGLDCVKVE